MLMGIILIGALNSWLTDAILIRDEQMLAFAVILTTLRYALIAWLLASVIAGIGNLVVKSLSINRRGLDAALIRLCSRILSIVAALTVVLYAAGQLGVSITPIIAGLGVGGLAVAWRSARRSRTSSVASSCSPTSRCGSASSAASAP